MNTTNILTTELYNFIDGLRLAGYNIGTAQYIAAQDIILALVAEGELPPKLIRLKTLLNVVLCHSPKEQEDFDRHFDNWMNQIEPLVSPDAKETPKTNIFISRTSAGVVVAAKSQKTWPTVIINIKPVLRKIKTQIITLWQWLLTRAASVWQAILQGPLKLWESQIQRFLVRKVTLTRPQIESLFVKGLEEKLFKSVNLTTIAKHLCTYTPIPTKQLDIEQTVEKTTQAAGLLSPVIESIKTIPHYLVLIDKVSRKDHQAQWVDVLINQLIAKGVLITRYYFHIEPRACYPEQAPLIPLSLEELRILYPKHRLMIFSDGSGLIDTSTNQVVHWINQLTMWLQRVLFTLETPEQWGYREQLLETVGFIIMPANEMGLAWFAEQLNTSAWYSYPKTSESVAANFPSHIEMPDRWLTDHAPDSAVFTELLIQIWDFLGQNGYYWFSACAVYPELQWPLTLYLGDQLTTVDGNQLFNEDCLAKLVRLPWFRYGYMPDWLRERLVNDLSLSQEREIRTALHNLLLTALDKPSRGFFPLEIAKPTRLASSAQQLLRRLKLSKPEAKDHYVLRDYVFPTFLASPLAVKIPKMLRTLLVKPQSIETLRATQATIEITPLKKSANRSLAKFSTQGMSEAHLQQETIRLQQRYDLLTQKIAELKQQKKSETRIGNLLYLQNLIEETTAEHEQVKKRMSQLTADIKLLSSNTPIRGKQEKELQLIEVTLPEYEPVQVKKGMSHPETLLTEKLSIAKLIINEKLIGTAWLIEHQYAIIAAHCIEDGIENVRLSFPTIQSIPALLIDKDAHLDIALLKLEQLQSDLQPLAICKHSDLDMADQANWLAHGYLGVVSDRFNTGITIGGKVRHFDIQFENAPAIQLLCQEGVNELDFKDPDLGGMSGAPVFSQELDNRVVGIIRYAPPEFGESILVATPVDVAVNRFSRDLSTFIQFSKIITKYVERPPIEATCYKEILKPGAFIRIKAPAKMGKTQLMNRIIEHAKGKGYITITLDIRLAGTKNVAVLDKFLRWVGTFVSDELNLPHELETYWKSDSSIYNLTRYFEMYLLPTIKSPLVLALDNVDFVFENAETAQDFCGLLRGWNQKAARSDNVFRKLHLIVVYSTEIYTTININSEPLAIVGLTVELPEFTVEQVHDLAQQYQLSWHETDITKLIELVGGHPYLLTEAFEQAVQQQCSLQKLLKNSHTEMGIYSNHLRQLLVELEKKPKLLDALKKVITTTEPVWLDTTSKFQLQKMGLLHLQNNKVIISRELYRQYFCDCLEVI